MPAASEFSVRAALPSDARAIADLWVRCWEDTYPNAERGITREAIAERIAFRNSGDGVARLQERLGDERADHACFVAISNEGGIVGFCCPYADSEGVQHVGALYVDARWHGRGPGPARSDPHLERPGSSGGALRRGVQRPGDRVLPTARLRAGQCQ